MKTARAPLIVLGLLYICFASFLIYSMGRMREPVAIHFNRAGEADGWTNQKGALVFMAFIGTTLPLLMVGISYVMRFMPDSLINLPHKEYWLSPERRGETKAFLVCHSLWFSCLALGFMMGMQWVLLLANQGPERHLPMPMFTMLVSGFVMGVIFWVMRMVSYFRHKKE